MTLRERVQQLIDKKEDRDACWEWKGTRNRDGYGLICYDPRRIIDGERVPEKQRNRKRIVSRLVYELEVGPIPDKMIVMHVCDNPPCCNRRHLRLGTQRENVLDAVHKGRWVTHKGVSGAKNGGAKLTEDQARDIIESFRQGSSQRYLASRYDLHINTVQRICTGKRWPHLQRE